VGSVQFDFTGTTVLVTGGSKGIGRGIAEAFGTAGAHVAVNYRTDADGAAEVCAAIEATGGTALAVQADVADPVAVGGLFEAVDRDLGPLDILVNNAGQSWSRQAAARGLPGGMAGSPGSKPRWRLLLRR
jgi:NAD(P)-dependent dehydrogenase (short-subunit alcohol dehydrogenase family)